jgi:hypothetical protein
MHPTLRRFRYKAARTALRRPLAWKQNRGLAHRDAFLASVERSGNTWLRFLLAEILTDREIGFDDVDSLIPEMGAHRGVAPILPCGGRLIKTHELYRGEYKKAVYVVRDLRDVLLSHYARDLSMGFAEYYFGKNGFDDYLLAFLHGRTMRYGSWQQHVQVWLESPLARSGNLLVVRFEDLRKHPEQDLKRIIEFLGAAATPERIGAAIRNNTVEKMREKEDGSRKSQARKAFLQGTAAKADDRRFVRSGSVQGWRQKLTPAQLELIQRHAGDVLTRLGYPDGTGPEKAGADLAAAIRAS